jgi:hypothetical protein
LVKIWVIDPPGSPYIVLPPAVWQLILEILTCFVINVSLWIFCTIKRSTLGSYWHNTIIWGHFWSQYGYLTPRGDPILCYHLLFCHWFWRNTNLLCHECIFGYFAFSNGPDWEDIWIIPIFGVIFGQNLGIWPSGVTIYRVTP